MRLRTISEALKSDVKRKVVQLADKVKKSFEKSDQKGFGFGAELAELHAKLADFYREYTDEKYKLDQANSKSPKDNVNRHYNDIKRLLSKMDYEVSDAYLEELEDYIDVQLKNYRDIIIEEPKDQDELKENRQPKKKLVQTDKMVQTILGKMPKFELVDEAAGALSLDQKPAEFNVALKKILKGKGVTVRSVRVVNAYNWPKCSVQVYGDIPNEIRLAALEAMYPGLKHEDQSKYGDGGMKDLGISDMNDIHYGNVTSNYVSVSAENWIKAVGSTN